MSYQKMVIISSFTLLSSLISLPVMAVSDTSLELISQTETNNLEKQAEILYQQGNYQEAIKLLQSALTNYGNNNNLTEQIIAWRNLALLYVKIGDFEQANNKINLSLQAIENLANNHPDKSKFLAKTLDIQGQIYLAQGNSEKALKTWQKSALIYHKNDDLSSLTKAKINQAQALQNLGLYNQVTTKLQELNDNLASSEDSLVKAKSLLSLGNIYNKIGRLQEAEDSLTKSLEIAKKLNSNQAVAEALLSLGNNQKLLGKNQEALAFYQQALENQFTPDLKLQIQLNKLGILITENTQQAEQLVTEIENQLKNNSLNKIRIESRIKLANNLMKMGGNKQQISEHLITAIKEAQKLKDKRLESYGLAILGKLYEDNKQYSEAEKLTSEGLLIAQEINAPEMIYQWQWQLGRILKQQEKNREAINAYTQSLKNLQAIRTDLIAITSDVQFNFKKNVEPVYRELVSLLLQPRASQADLRQGRQVIEDLQLAELDNFFNDACLDAKPKNVDDLDRTAAIFYTVILEDRLEVILAIPGKPLINYRTIITKNNLQNFLNLTKRNLFLVNFNSSQTMTKTLNKLYTLLITPIEKDLIKYQIKNLVFIQDVMLKNIPMSTLYDGEKYLIEKYRITLAPSLQLIDPSPLNIHKINMFSGGLSEARQGFSALPGVEIELKSIEKEMLTKPVLNALFTGQNINKDLKNTSYQIVHLATHGVFSSNQEDTFILTYDDKININELNAVLRRPKITDAPIELLVLSACETAVGDEKATLGLAGVAVRAGARTTVASFWSVSDDATVLLMSTFYRELAKGNITKSEAFQRAQITVLRNEKFAHPYYWSAFVMLGNWL